MANLNMTIRCGRCGKALSLPVTERKRIKRCVCGVGYYVERLSDGRYRPVAVATAAQAPTTKPPKVRGWWWSRRK